MQNNFTNSDFDFSFPFKKFSDWFSEAEKNPAIKDAIATTLATSDADGKPSARIIFVKNFNENGFDFFTNYNSHKSRDLIANPNACLNYYYEPLQKQIRIGGKVEKISAEESDAYFNKRPLESRIASALSNQSSNLNSFEEFAEKISVLTEEYKDKHFSRPENWGGWRLKPDYFEFFEMGEFRIHTRESYKLNTATNTWLKTLLYP